MGSKTQKSERIRARKSAPNKANRKAELERIRENLNVVGALEEKKPKK